MFKVPWPAMVCNAHNLDGFLEYKMWNTRKVTKDVPPAMLALNIASVAKSAPEKRLAALVLNAHAYPGHLGLGTGIDEVDTKDFAPLKGLVGDIYIVACGIAGFRKNRAHTEYLDGSGFCSALAKHTGAYVYAPTGGQRQTKEDRSEGIPVGFIDDFEGEALAFLPNGTSQPWNKSVPLLRKIFR